MNALPSASQASTNLGSSSTGGLAEFFDRFVEAPSSSAIDAQLFVRVSEVAIAWRMSGAQFFLRLVVLTSGR